MPDFIIVAGYKIQFRQQVYGRIGIHAYREPMGQELFSAGRNG